MKALSVKQPWATLLVGGRKTIEVRSWKTAYRGSLVICASAAPKNVFWFDEEGKVHRLLHAGCIIGIVDLLDCRPLAKSDEEAACCDYVPNAYAWVTSAVSFCRPDRIVGRLNLFDVSDEKLVRIADNETDWIFNYPTPQGAIKFTERCPVLD